MNKKDQKIKKIAILTSGGDSPGMNAAIIAIVKYATIMNIISYIIYEGYKGLVEDNIQEVKQKKVSKFMSKGGTFIYSSRYPNFKNMEIQKKAITNLKKHNIDALFVIGGNGSYLGAKSLSELGVKVIAIPGTIDNDIAGTEKTIGFDSALNMIINCVDAIRNTAESHNRLFLIETMGRNCSDLTINAGIAVAAEVVITKHNIFNIDDFVKATKMLKKNNKRSIIFMISEKIYGIDGRKSLNDISDEITKRTGISSRVLVVGHLQRGAIPTAAERVLATKFGIFAIDLLLNNKHGYAIANNGSHFFGCPFDKKKKNEKLKNNKWIQIINKLHVK